MTSSADEPRYSLRQTAGYLGVSYARVLGWRRRDLVPARLSFADLALAYGLAVVERVADPKVGLGLVRAGGDRLRPVSLSPAPCVSIAPDTASGAPCISGTEIPTATLFERWTSGESIGRIAVDCGIASERIESAIRFEARMRR